MGIRLSLAAGRRVCAERWSNGIAALLASALLGCASAAVAAEPAGVVGVWRNARDSVRIEISECGTAICGVVVWANDKARESARKGGTEQLVGTNLLRDFVRHGDDTWRGRAFVPDLNRTVSGTVKLVGPNTLRVRSCALGLVCKSKIWTRIS